METLQIMNPRTLVGTVAALLVTVSILMPTAATARKGDTAPPPHNPQCALDLTGCRK